MMKCPNCGAEIAANSKFCDSCGSQISYEMLREQELLNRPACPKCGSTNLQFRRENQGEVRGKNTKRVIHRTVGLCKDCGYTWYNSEDNTGKKNNMIWWVLGWIFFFPAPVMVLIWRKKNKWDIKIKIAVTIVFWILLFILSKTRNKDDAVAAEIRNAAPSPGQTVAVEAEAQRVENQREEESAAERTGEAESKTDYTDNSEDEQSPATNLRINELPVMNGTQTERIGTYSMCYMFSEDCTEEVLAEWYAEIKDKGYNWNIIRYVDFAGDENTGVYANYGLIEKDVRLADDGSILSSEGETIYLVNEDGSLSLLE